MSPDPLNPSFINICKGGGGRDGERREGYMSPDPLNPSFIVQISNSYWLVLDELSHWCTCDT